MFVGREDFLGDRNVKKMFLLFFTLFFLSPRPTNKKHRLGAFVKVKPITSYK